MATLVNMRGYRETIGIMPKSTDHTLRCACGTSFHATVYNAVNVTEEPRLQYTVLAGLLNVVTCPNCGRKAALAQPFIYHDMKRELLLYVDPRTNVAEEERQKILEWLQAAYAMAIKESEKQASEHATETRAAPPLQVVFGMDQLIELISRVLPPEEALGKLALNTRSRRPEERQRLLDIAREMARQVGCQVEEQEDEDEYTVWLYGSRRVIGTIMSELAPRQ